MSRTFTMHGFSQISFVLGDKPTVVTFPITTGNAALIAHLLDLGAKEVTEPAPKPKPKPKPKPVSAPASVPEPAPEPVSAPAPYVWGGGSPAPEPTPDPSQGGEA